MKRTFVARRGFLITRGQPGLGSLKWAPGVTCVPHGLHGLAVGFHERALAEAWARPEPSQP